MTGFAAWQSGVWAPTQWSAPIWARIRSYEPPAPLTDTIRSPGLSTAAAGLPRSTAATFSVGPPACPCESSSTQMIKNAIRMLTAGPALITKIRFHTAWL